MLLTDIDSQLSDKKVHGDGHESNKILIIAFEILYDLIEAAMEFQ